VICSWCLKAAPARVVKGLRLDTKCFELPLAGPRDGISSGCAFEVAWLKKQGVRKWPHKWWKLITDPAWQNRLNSATRTRPSWNGHNASGWCNDIVAANGFDERLRYGGEDRELGERMVNAGIRPVQLRYSAIYLHLDHARGYVRKEERRVNDQIRRNTHAQRLTVTQHGLNLHADHVDHPELWDQSNNIL